MELVIKFYLPEQGGRDILPDLSSGQYRPHLVIEGGPHDEYLGVQFMGCPESVKFGVDVHATIKLLYDMVDYSGLVQGASFVIKEGRHSVGAGYVKQT